MKLAPTPLVLAIAFAAACGRTDPGDWLLDPSASAGQGGTATGGDAGRGPRGVTGGVSGSGGGGRGGAAGSGGKAAVCEDGIVGPGETCEPGFEPAAPGLEIRQGAWRMPILPLVDSTPATAHYAYASRSSHTGFEAPEQSTLYLYRWAPETALSLVIVNGIDEDSSGVVQPQSDIVFEIEGLPDSALIAISDDDVEFVRTTGTRARADWDCNRNSDGGLIMGLPFPGSWHVTITPSFRAGITRWSFFTGREVGIEDEISLDLSQPIEIVAYGCCRPVMPR